MKPLHALILLACLFMFAQTMAFNDEIANGAEIGCITDSECEGVSVETGQCPDDARICNDEDTTP